MSEGRWPAQLANGFQTGGGGHTIHDTNALPGGTIAVHFRVTVAGTIRFEDEWGDTADLPWDTGTYVFEMSNLKRVHTSGTSATLDPVNTVFPLCAKGVS